MDFILVSAAQAASSLSVPDLTSPAIFGTVEKSNFDWLISIIDPIAQVAVSVILPSLATWLAVQLSTLLRTIDTSKTLEIESQMRDALHLSALRGLKFAFVRMGINVPQTITPPILKHAMAYVKDKNPETLADLGVHDDALADIIRSKLPDVALIAAAAVPLSK